MALPRVERIFGAEIKRWTIQVPHGLDGWEVAVHGLPATMVDVLVRIAMKDGRVVESGLTDRVLDDPRAPYTQLLVSSILQV